MSVLLGLHLGSGLLCNSFKYTSQLSSVCFSVVGFILRVLTYLDLSFVHGIRYKSVFILLHVKAAPFV